MSEIAQAYVQIIPTTKGIKSALTQELGGAADEAGESTGSSIASKIKGAILAAGIGTAIVGVMKSALAEGGELQQNLGGTEAVFGNFANSIQQSASEAYRNMGLSASDYMATANKMGSLFQGSGLTQQRALELTSSAMQRAADVASVMGIDTAAAMESIAGAAKGNFTMMDNLGVAMNATTLSAYALEKGINFNWNTASNAEKAELAMQMFMDRTSQYAGNFARESEQTLSGSIGSIKAAVQDLLGNLALGNDLTEPINNVVNSLVGAAQNIMPVIANVVSAGIPAVLNAVLQLLPMLLAYAPQIIATGGQLVADLLLGIAQALPTLIPQAVQAVLTIVQGLISAIPNIIAAAAELLTGLVQGLLDAIPLIVEALPQIWNTICDTLLTSIPLIIQTGITLFTALIGALPQIITTIVAILPDIINNIINTIISLLPVIINAGITLFTALIDNLPTIISAIVQAIPTIIVSIVSALMNNLPTIINAGITLFVALVQALPQIISFLVGVIPNIISSLIKGFADNKGQFAEAGKNLLLGLGDGIKNAVSAVVQKAKDAAQDVVDAIKKKLGIASPSRVMMEVGGYVDEGLAVGISDNTKSVQKAMSNLTSATVPNMTAGNYVPSGIATQGNVVNMGGITIEVNARDGRSAREIAEEVNHILAQQVNQSRAVFA